MTEWLIDLSRDRERGCARGEREDVWQLAVNDPCHFLLSIQTPAPPIFLSEVPLDNSWVTSSHRWEWALFYLQKKWDSLDHPLLNEGGFCFFFPRVSLAEWCAWLFNILISVAALRSAGTPEGFPAADKVISVATKTFLIDGCHLSLWILWSLAFKAFLNTRFWRTNSCCLVQISSFEKVVQEWLGCPLVVGSSNIQEELKLSVVLFLPKLAKLLGMNFPAHKHN